jgi:3-oxoadipate enol-lactonase
MRDHEQPVCAHASLGRPVGSAPTIVFSHSLGADRDMFAPQLEAFAGDHHVLAVDTRGHGHAAVTPGPYSLASLTRDLLAAIDAAGVGRFHFCGISMGGLLGLSLALCAPERMLSLAACNTAARVGSEQSWQARIEAVRAGGMDGICDAVVPRWFAPGFPTAQPARYQATLRTFRATDPVGYIG